MATETFWGVYDCKSCSTKGITCEPAPGEDQPRCPNCGNPREQDDGEAPYLTNSFDPTTGQILGANYADTKEEMDIALGGADVKCSRCGGDNRAREKNCVGCGAPLREDPPQRDEPQERGPRPSTPPARNITPAYTPSPNYGGRDREREEWYPQERLNDHGRDEIGTAAGVYGAVAVVVVALVIGAVVWAFQSHDVPGKVTSMAWEHRVDTQTYSLVSKEDWEDDITVQQPRMPVNGSGEKAGAFDVRSCSSRHYRDRSYKCGEEKKCSDATRRVEAGSHKECSSPKSNKNGSFSQDCDMVKDYKLEHYEDCRMVDKTCVEKIYKDWCAYSTYEWKTVGTKNMGGGATTTNPLPWPDVVSGPQDRLVRHESYSVAIGYDNGDGPESYTHDVSTEGAFHTWSLNEEVTLSVRNMGTVAEVKRKK